MCGEREETVGHIVAECKMLAQKYYKNWRHDKVAQVVHRRLCKSYGLESGDVWYKHEPKPVIENELTKKLGISPFKQIIQSRLTGPILLS